MSSIDSLSAIGSALGSTTGSAMGSATGSTTGSATGSTMLAAMACVGGSSTGASMDAITSGLGSTDSHASTGSAGRGAVSEGSSSPHAESACPGAGAAGSCTCTSGTLSIEGGSMPSRSAATMWSKRPGCSSSCLRRVRSPFAMPGAYRARQDSLRFDPCPAESADEPALHHALACPPKFLRDPVSQ